MSAPRKNYILNSNKSRSATPSRPPGSTKAPPAAPTAAAEDRRIGEYSSEDDVCPVCKSDRYLNPKLRLMVSFCYHKMCESCMDRIFSLGPEPCPVCRVTIRKNGFKPQMFENLAIQKEVAIRKRTGKIFNKREEDFKDLTSYNNYLEDYENITFNLIHDQDIEQTETTIRQYEAENRAQIEANLSKADREANLVKAREEENRKHKLAEKLRIEREEEEDEAARKEERRRVLEGLESGTADADDIVQAARTSALRRATARTSSPMDLSNPRLAQLPSLAGLKEDEDGAAEPEDILADVKRYYAYDDLYDVRPRSRGYLIGGGAAEESDVGGFVVEECWEKAIRAGVAGLWTVPIGWGEEKGGAGQVKVEDVEMGGA